MSRPDPIYLDHASSSKLRPVARQAMNAAWDLGAGNPASTHHAGRALRRLLEDSREKTAALLRAFPDEVIFTSGATESNNLALTGLIPAAEACGLIASPIEHASVRQPLEALHLPDRPLTSMRQPLEALHLPDRPLTSMRQPLEALRWPDRPLVWVSPQTSGQIALEALQTALAAMDSPAGLVTLQLANQETGALQPVAALGPWLAANKPGWRFHTDATQAAGKVAIDFHRMRVDTLAASAHKFGGPVGVGLLLVRRGTRLTALLKGGGQQDERRAGTESAALAAGLAAALEESCAEIADFRQRTSLMTRELVATLQSQCAPVLVNSPEEEGAALPHIMNLSFPGIRGDTLLMALDLERLAVSAGSACASGSMLPSPVLLSSGLPEERVRSAIRLSLGWSTRSEEIAEAARRIGLTVNRLRAANGLHPSDRTSENAPRADISPAESV